jgi:hypothetical protein
MNELIRSLALQAHNETLVAYRNRMETEFAGDVIFSDMYDQKFAELIVRECAGICDDYGMPDSTSQTAMILSMTIKHKFGIKDVDTELRNRSTYFGNNP